MQIHECRQILRRWDSFRLNLKRHLKNTEWGTLFLWGFEGEYNSKISTLMA